MPGLYKVVQNTLFSSQPHPGDNGHGFLIGCYLCATLSKTADVFSQRSRQRKTVTFIKFREGVRECSCTPLLALVANTFDIGVRNRPFSEDSDKD